MLDSRCQTAWRIVCTIPNRNGGLGMTDVARHSSDEEWASRAGTSVLLYGRLEHEVTAGCMAVATTGSVGFRLDSNHR